MMNCFARSSLVAAASAVVLFRMSSAHGAPPGAQASAPAVSESTRGVVAPNDTPEKGDGDLVETIDANAPPTPAVPTVPVPAADLPPSVTNTPAPELSPAPPSPDRFELHGWARQSLEIGLAKRSPQSSDADPTAQPYDQLTARTQLFMRARYSHARWFEANISGVVSYSLFEQAQAHAATTFDGINGQSIRGVLEPQLYELVAGFFSPHLDLRVGQ